MYYNNIPNMSAQSLSYNLLDAKVKSLNSEGPVSASKLNIPVSAGVSAVGTGTVGAVACTAVTASSLILATYAVAGARTLPLDVTVLNAGVGFTVTGDAAATFNYLVIN